MRKKIQALAIILAMLLTMIPAFTVSATEYAHQDIEMQYSTDGVTWTTITGDECFLRDSAYQQDLNVGNNVFYVYFKFTGAPAGWRIPSELRYGFSPRNKADNFGNNGTLIGTTGTVATGSLNQLKVYMRLEPDDRGVYKIPIKNEESWAAFTYKDTSNTEYYFEINFRSKQPRLTSFANHMSASESVLFIGGAAVNNDNGTALQVSKASGDNRMFVMGNVSESLLGTSIFMFPSISSSDKTLSNMFDFAADTGGTAYVIFDDPAENSNYDSWTNLNNGSMPNEIDSIRTSTTNYILPRTYNSYTGAYNSSNTDENYFAFAMNWVVRTNSNDCGAGNNVYRSTDPGVYNNTSSTHVVASWDMYRVYSKDFNANETVVIPAWGNSTVCCAVLIKWDLGEELSVAYSADGENFSYLSGFTPSTETYNVPALPDYTKYAYVKLINGYTKPKNMTTYSDFHGPSGRIGDGTLATNSSCQANCGIPALTDGYSGYVVPIKSENGQLEFDYTDGNGTTRTYSINFTAKQERLTAFTDNTTNQYGDVVFVSGAAANNDNGTITETSARGKPSYIRAIGNISKPLVGASLFMLPNMSSSDYDTGKTVFSFRADHGGYIVVMSDTNFDGASVYESGEEGWAKVNNTNWGVNYVSMSNKALNQSRAYNDYWGVDYLAISIKWHIESYTSNTTGYNLYRLVDPGVDGNTTIDNSAANAPTVGAWYMSRAYKKTFEAGELVEVKGWGGGGSQDMGIFVKWYDDANASSPIDVKYSADNSTFTSIPNFSETKYHYSVRMPKNSKFAYVKMSNLEEDKEISREYTSWSVRNTKFETTFGGATGDDLVGTAGDMGTNSYRQTQVPMDALTENGAYVIPIKNEEGIFEFEYKNRTYTIRFFCKQPRLTELNDNTSNSEGGVIYVSGGAAWNDNGTITETSSNGTGAQKIRSIANISPELIGASIFMLPKYQDGTNETGMDGTMFSFRADHSGKIVVMNDSAISNSGYGTWTEENNGTTDNAGILSGSRAMKARTVNNYDNVGDYYAISFGWWCEGSSNNRWGYNAFRSYYPGVYTATRTYGSTPNDCDAIAQSTTGAFGMAYCYSKTFNANELVEVPGWGTSNTSPDQAIFVLWDDDVTTADVSKTSTLFEKTDAAQSTIQSFSNILQGDSNTVDWSSNYIVAFGAADYSAFNDPDNIGFILYADGERMPRYYQAQSIVNGKFGILIFGLEEGPEYTVKNYVKYGTADPVIQED